MSMLIHILVYQTHGNSTWNPIIEFACDPIGDMVGQICIIRTTIFPQMQRDI